MLLNSLFHFRAFEPAAGSSSTQSLDGFRDPQGEHHQHQLEMLLNSLFHFRAFEPTAGEQFDPVIGRIQRPVGRASSASAGNAFELTLPFPGL